MSQIKLRRDTLANFTSSNPVLGLGEPAYETDTKRLKIGDGSTAYTQLAYFSSGGGSGTDITASLPLKIEDGVISLEVDGQTIQIVDGKLHANTDELGNEVNDLSGRVTAAEADITTIQTDITDINGDLDKKVTLDSTQTISGEKTFSSTVNLDNNGMRFNNDSGWVGFAYWESKGPAIDFRPASFSTASNQVAGSIVLKTGIDGSSVYHLAPSGLRRQSNEGTIQATFFDSSNLTAGNNITITGSDNNGYIISATGGSTPDNMVTTDTAQTISGQKTFKGDIYFDCTATKVGSFGFRAKHETGSTITESIVFGGQLGTNNNLQFGVEDATMTIIGNPIRFDNTPQLTTGSNLLTDSLTDKVTISSWSMPNTSDSSSKPTVGASGTEYTMPFNGYVVLIGQTNASGAYGSIDILDGSSWLTIGGLGNVSIGAGIYSTSSFIPVLKNQKYRVRYNNLEYALIIQYPLLGGETA